MPDAVSTARIQVDQRKGASIRGPDGGSGYKGFASFFKGPLPPSGPRIEHGTLC